MRAVRHVLFVWVILCATFAVAQDGPQGASGGSTDHSSQTGSPPLAVEPDGSEAPSEPANSSIPTVAASLAKALESRVTVWERDDGSPIHVSHCRATPEGGCRVRIARFSRWIAEVARAFELDAFVLAAMAVRESGLDPFVRGAVGEYGLIQLHPRGVGRRVRFVQSEHFRQRCRRRPGACQREVLTVGARLLQDSKERCGDLQSALTAYNRGECGASDYSRRVLEERATLLALAKRDATPPALE